MKTISVLAVLWLSGLTVAALPLCEPFDYSADTSLLGKSPQAGSTWLKAGPDGTPPMVRTGALEVPDFLAAEGNLVQLAAVEGPGARLPIGGVVEEFDNCAYFSFMLAVEDLTGLASSGIPVCVAGFDPANQASTSFPGVLGARVWLKAAGEGFKVGLTKSSSAPVDVSWDTIVYEVGDILLIIASYDWEEGDWNGDNVRLWVMEDTYTADFFSELPDPTLNNTAGEDLPRIASITLLPFPPSTEPTEVHIDELRVGLTWAAVAPAGPPQRDFGDAPAPPYPTLLPAGARHRIGALRLGTLLDAEANGQPPDLDGLDEDSDGVAFAPFLTPGIASSVTIVANGPPGYVDVWINWDGVPGWGAADHAVPAAAHPGGGASVAYPFAVPAGAVIGFTWARVRLGLDPAGLPPAGFGGPGEVADYRLEIRAPADLSVALDAAPLELREGEQLAVTVSAQNNGLGPATGVELTLGIPPGAVLQSVDSEKGNCQVLESEVVCTFSTIAAQDTGTMLATFVVDAEYAEQSGEESYAWDLDIDGYAPEHDPNPVNNEAHALVAVIPNLDFGDARMGYPVTTGVENGARHINGTTFHMGAAFDREPNGVHSANATHDDVTGVDDEDGVVLPGPLLAGRTHAVTVTVPVGGLLDAFFDFNNDNDWFDAGERVTPAVGLAIGPGAAAVPVAVPLGAATGSPHARFRFSDVGGLAPVGFYAVGEVEDVQVEVRRVDFGNAPDLPYPTRLLHDGARHVVDPAWRLGALLDWEPDGPDPAPPDEDGVVFGGAPIRGMPASVQVTASIAGLLDAFVDFNADGDWIDAGERITLAAGTSLVAGLNTVTFTVPASATTGPTWARFRFSDVGALGPSGAAPRGEVEDYQRDILPSIDLSGSLSPVMPDADVDSPFTFMLIVDNKGPDAASSVTVTHVVGGVNNSIILASCTQGDCDVISEGESNRITCSLGTLAPQAEATVEVVLTPKEEGDLSVEATVTGTGGETHPEDNIAALIVPVVFRDYGDAPESYHTLKVSNGPRHRIRPGWRLGALIDPDPNGMPSAGAVGDDTGDGNDDEDSVTFSPIIPGLVTTFQVQVTAPGSGYLNVWMDLDRNTNFADPSEHVVVDYPVTGGTAVYTPSFLVPTTAASGLSYARFRLTADPGISYDGPAPTGEVEDYGVECHNLDYGDAPDGYLTTRGVDGARHVVIPQLHLGDSADEEDDGHPGAGADGDDNDMPLAFDDEDGLMSLSGLRPGDTATFEVYVEVPGMTTAYLDAWVDLDSDGHFDHPAELVIPSAAVTLSGTHSFYYAVPMSAVSGLTYARLRLSTVGGLTPQGWVGSGEVEDYQVDIGPPVMVYNGFEHQALGSATLEVVSNELHVGNLGSTGEDGVAINLAEAEGWKGDVAIPFAPATSPDGSKLIWTIHGMVDGTPNQLVATGRMEVQDDSMYFFADSSAIGATAHLVQVYDRGVLVASETVEGTACLKFMGQVPEALEFRLPIPEDTAPTYSCRLASSGPVIIGPPDGRIVDGNDFLIWQVAPSAFVESFFDIWIELTAPPGSEMIVRDTAVQKFGLWHSALGGARMQLTGDVGQDTGRLTVSNLGPTGDDGIRTEIDGVDGIAFRSDDGFALNFAPGTSLRLAPVGTIVSEELALGAFEFLNPTLTADFSPIAVTQVLVEMWDGTQLAGSVSVPNGVLGTITGTGDDHIYSANVVGYACFRDGSGGVVMELEFLSPVTFTPASGTLLVGMVGDRLRCVAGGPSPVDELVSLGQTLIGLGEIVLVIPIEDWADAPGPYPVRNIENGARHRYAPGWRLGTYWDHEFGGTHSPAADYDDTHGSSPDDEDGVVVLSAVGAITVEVTAAVDGVLQVWVDFNRDGDWADAGEQVVPGMLLTAATPRMFYIPVPAGTPAGSFVSRWRLSEAGGLAETGYGGKGEVEDHILEWQPADFGDAPNEPTQPGYLYSTVLSADGARHAVVSGMQLGAAIDVEPDGQPSMDAMLDDSTGMPDDEDGVLFMSSLARGAMASVQVYPSVGGMLDAWVDFGADHDWDLTDKIFSAEPVSPGMPPLNFLVPGTAALGPTYARFRFSGVAHLPPNGPAPDGEVEDYRVEIVPGPGEVVWLENPTSGVSLYCHIHRPAGFDAKLAYPGLVLVPGGVAEGTSFDLGDRAQHYADLGFIVVHFDPESRGESTNGGSYTDENYCGFLHQDGLHAVLEYLVDLVETDNLNIGILSSSYGVTMATGVLARYPHNPGVKFLVDWEGPADRSDTAWPNGHVPYETNEEELWAEREATGFIDKFGGYYLRVQSEKDHVQIDNEHAVKLVNLATHTRYGGGGRCVWTRVNSAAGLTANRPNAVYSLEDPPEWIPEGAPNELLMEQYLVELAGMPPLAGPVRVIFDLHQDPMQAIPEAGRLDAYNAWRDAANWALDVCEARGARVTFLAGGEYFEYTLEDLVDGDALLQRMYASGGSIGTHMHREEQVGPHDWIEVPGNPPLSGIRSAWEDHIHLANAAIARALGLSTPAEIAAVNNIFGTHMANDPAVRLDLMADYGFFIHEQGPEEEFFSYFQHHAMNPYRPARDHFLSHDPGGLVVLSPFGPVLGKSEVHYGIAQDMRVAAVQARFLLEVLNWLHDVHVAGSGRVWTAGWAAHGHDLLPGGPSYGSLVPMLNWLKSEFVDQTVGGYPAAAFSSSVECRDLFEAWEAVHPGASPFDYPASITDWNLYPYLRPPAAYLADALYQSGMPAVGTVRWHALIAAPASATPFTVYVAYSIDGLPVTVDLSPHIAMLTIAAVDTVSGTASVVPTTAVPVPPKGVILVPENCVLSLRFDMGDAPDGYPVCLAEDGARHEPSSLRMGANWDWELDGQPSRDADRDDLTGLTDDEDGVLLPPGFPPGTVASVTVLVNGGPARLDAWFDWNRDMDWDDPSEHVLASLPVAPGPNTVSIAVPAGASRGRTAARFRLSSAGSPLPTGEAADGEVEDVVVKIATPPVIVDMTTGAGGTIQLNSQSEDLVWVEFRASMESDEPWRVLAGPIPAGSWDGKLPEGATQGIIRLRMDLPE